MRPGASLSGPPARLARAARISARIESAVSAGVSAAMSRAAGAEAARGRRGPEAVAKDPPAVEPAEPAPAALELGVPHDALLARLELRQHDGALLARHQAQHPLDHLRIRHLHVDVDLAAARKPDGERLVVGDAVREELRRRAVEHLPRRAVD